MLRWVCLLAFVLLIRECRGQNRYDVVISEFMSDPSPVVGLPNVEWVEIRNVSGSAISLQGWRLFDKTSQSGPLPAFMLQPDSLLIICSSSGVPLLSAYGTTIAVSSFPSLDNGDDIIGLRSQSGKTIHAIHYEAGWAENELKAEGGWTLEMIDRFQPCLGRSNWSSSQDPAGGTPGKVNSIERPNDDEDAPVLLHSYALDSITIRIVFNEPVDSLGSTVVSNYSLTPSMQINAVTVIPPLFNEVELKLSSSILPNEIYSLTVRDIADCRGNRLSSATVRTGLASAAEPGDWIINEILFNPRPNGYDYVELVNRSEKILNLNKLYLASRSANGNLSSISLLSETPFLIFPADYLVFTEDLGRLELLYHVKFPARVRELSMPSYPDAEGTVVALGEQGLVLDELEYDEDWHFDLIADPEGVSLERLNKDAPTREPMNWHSAASSAGYGTPGYENSQFGGTGSSGATVEAVPTVVSPDNDGRDDMLFIQYSFPEPGYMVTISIFDFAGRPVRELIRNKLAGAKGSWQWDGLDDKGMKLHAGMYILLTEIFHPSGKKEIFKKSIAVASEL